MKPQPPSCCGAYQMLWQKVSFFPICNIQQLKEHHNPPKAMTVHAANSEMLALRVGLLHKSSDWR